MKHIPNVAGALLGLMFVAFGLMMLLQIGPEPPQPEEGSWAALFMSAMVPSGYMTFVKVMEIAGGVLVAIPRTRAAGLLVLGPIVVNIFAYHAFIGRGEGLADPVTLAVGALTLVCLAAEAKAFLRLAFKTED